jgi:hypothetical protein
VPAILDHGRIDAGALDGGAHGKRGQLGAGGDIEFAAVRLGQRGAGS